jgi:hypothetical protein
LIRVSSLDSLFVDCETNKPGTEPGWKEPVDQSDQAVRTYAVSAISSQAICTYMVCTISSLTIRAYTVCSIGSETVGTYVISTIRSLAEAADVGVYGAAFSNQNARGWFYQIGVVVTWQAWQPGSCKCARSQNRESEAKDQFVGFHDCHSSWFVCQFGME